MPHLAVSHHRGTCLPYVVRQADRQGTKRLKQECFAAGQAAGANLAQSLHSFHHTPSPWPFRAYSFSLYCFPGEVQFASKKGISKCRNFSGGLTDRGAARRTLRRRGCYSSRPAGFDLPSTVRAEG